MAAQISAKRSVQDIAAELGSDTEKGLTIEQAHERIHSRGRNAVRLPKARSAASGMVRHMLSLMNVVLILMAIMHLVGEGENAIVLSVCLVGCAFINAAVGFINFRRDNSPLAAAQAAQNENVRVVRSGIEKTVNGVLLAQGDVIFMEKGQMIAADAKIIECSSLVVDESIINGDSSSVSKSAQGEADNDSASELYMGTKILGGSVKAIVTAVGDKTQLGSTIGMLKTDGDGASSLAKKNETIGNIFGLTAAAVWAAALMLRLANGYGVISAFDNSISAALAAIPVALPLLLLATMSIDALRLRKHGVQARSASAIEALGASSMLCVGKRGTLTRPDFGVGQVKAGKGFDENGLRLLAAMCTTADMSGAHPVGEAAQVALIEDAVAHGYLADDIRTKAPIERVIDSRRERRIMTTVHKTKSGYTIICKGAPDAVAACCGFVYDNGARPFDASADLSAIIADSSQMSADALSVMAVAYKDVDSLDENLESGLIFVGLVGLSNDVRSDSAPAVKELKSMGVKTCLITNENLTTAAAIAAKCGISCENAVNGASLDLNDLRRLRKTSVFAEVTPKQKEQIVSALNSRRENVAVIGRSARDIGAMNSGEVSLSTDAGAKICWAAADIRVSGSSLERIASALKACKRTFINLERMTGFMLSCNIAQIICAIVSLAMGYSTPFTPMGIMWLNVCIAAVGAVGIWLEPFHSVKGEIKQSEINTMKSGHLAKTTVSGALIWGIIMGAAAMAVYGATTAGVGISQRRAMVLLILCVGYSFMAQSRRSREPICTRAFANIGAIICFALNILAILIAFNSKNMRSAFGIGQMGAGMAVLCICVGIIPTLIAEAVKLIKKRRVIGSER